METDHAGIGIGSTTVKLVLMDKNDNIIYRKNKRHQAHIKETLAELLAEAQNAVGGCDLQLKITGSGSISLGKALELDFVQEFVAAATALKKQLRRPTLSSSLAVRMPRSSIFHRRAGRMHERCLCRWYRLLLLTRWPFFCRPMPKDLA